MDERSCLGEDHSGFTFRIGGRVVNGVGEFYDRATSLRFVPRGNNYIRLGPQTDESGHTIIYHSTFDPGAYDPARTQAAFQRMHDAGYSVVRVFWSHVTLMKAGQFDPVYLAHVVDLLQKAKANGLYVMFTMDGIPGGKYGDILWRACCERFSGYNIRYLALSGLSGTQAFLMDYIQALMAASAPLDAIFAWELRIEMFFDIDQPPLSLTSGLIRTANGKTYDMSKPAEKQLMVDEGLVYWIDSLRTAIRALDPTVLVTGCGPGTATSRLSCGMAGLYENNAISNALAPQTRPDACQSATSTPDCAVPCANLWPARLSCGLWLVGYAPQAAAQVYPPGSTQT